MEKQRGGSRVFFGAQVLFSCLRFAAVEPRGAAGPEKMIFLEAKRVDWLNQCGIGALDEAIHGERRKTGRARRGQSVTALINMHFLEFN